MAEYYQQLAIDLHMGKEDYFRQRDEIIRSYKEMGKRSEIQNELKKLKQNFIAQELLVPKDLCWLYGTFLEDYLNHPGDLSKVCKEKQRANGRDFA